MRPSNPQYTINSKGLTAKGIGDVFFRDPKWNSQDVPRFYLSSPHHPHHVAVAEGEISNPKRQATVPPVTIGGMPAAGEYEARDVD